MPGIESIPTTTTTPILGARQAALQYLIDETKRWSDTEIVRLDDSNEAHITVTFISPRLLQAVYLNKILEQGYIPPDFEAQTQKMLYRVAERDELIFLLTITMVNNGSLNLPAHILDIPLKEMVLTNGADITITLDHDDHILDHPIHSSPEPVFGYLAYPLAVLGDGKCNWVLEPKYNTSIVITVRAIRVDGMESGPYAWTIPYSPLMDTDIPSIPPMVTSNLGFTPDSLSPLQLPPSDVNNPNYWQDLARFIWNQVTLGNY
jgi:hypothetical protein